MKVFDYVIVGAGTAGCVLAYRLAEKGHSVCVLEAGPPDRHPLIRIPAGFMKTYTMPALIWQFEHEGTPNTYDRRIPFVQGRVLGGSSALNGTIYNRGQAWDYDNWAALGNAGWDYASVLPYFRRSERFMGEGDDAYRGREGRIVTDVILRRDAVCDSFIRGAVETGSAPNADYNGREQAGASYAQATVYKGLRWSAAHGYLHPARRQHGVQVLTHALVRRVLFEAGRAVGVEYTGPGDTNPVPVRARICAVVSAGAINTPRLLQVSGIGPGALLQQHGIPVFADLPGVGENLHDHYAARIVARARPGVDTINGRARGWPLAREVGAWVLRKPSLLGMSVVSAYAFCKVDPASPVNDFTLTFTPASMKEGTSRKLDELPGVTVGAWGMRPESRGHVRIRSADIEQPPVIQPNYLATERDRQVMVAAVKRAAAILRSQAMAHIVERQIFPATACQTDDEWLDFVRRCGMTTYHVVGTARMGADSDPMAVVDGRLRVRGVPGLRVVDASVMPAAPSGNTNAATLMIAEKAAEIMLGEARQA